VGAKTAGRALALRGVAGGAYVSGPTPDVYALALWNEVVLICIVRAGPDRDLAAALPFAGSIDRHLAYHDLQTSHTRTGASSRGMSRWVMEDVREGAPSR
jgi:hypothetical protein